MAQVIDATKNLVKLNSGQTITANQGAWYDAQQYWGGTLSAPGVINSQSNQQGAGQAVSKETANQSNPGNYNYIQTQQQNYKQQAPTNQPPIQPVNNNPGYMSGAPVTPSNGSGTGVGFGVTAPTMDLPGLYKQYYDASGISAIEAELSTKEKAYNDRVAKINDDPYLAESTRVGRLAKLKQVYDSDTASLKNDVAVKRADIDVKLNLQSKQFDINSQQAQLNLQQFNTLLSMGALSNASGDDIANIVRSTGLSSSMVLSAIQKQKSGEIKPQVIQETDNNGNVTVAVIDANTGNIISQNNLGAIGKTSTSGAGGLTTTQTRDVTGQARSVIQTIDEQYRTIGSKIEKLQFKEDYKGDKKLSAQEYMKAVEMLMAQTGIDVSVAGQFITQAMKDMNYSSWVAK